MKYLVFLAFFAIGAKGLSQDIINRVAKEVQEVGMQCAEKEQATADDIQELIDQKFPPTSHSAKCVISCIYEHYKLFNPDGSFNKQVSIDLAKEIKDDDPEMYAKVLEIIDTCHANVEVKSDKCETGSEMASCVTKEAAKRGISSESLGL